MDFDGIYSINNDTTKQKESANRSLEDPSQLLCSSHRSSTQKNDRKDFLRAMVLEKSTNISFKDNNGRKMSYSLKKFDAGDIAKHHHLMSRQSAQILRK